MGTKSGRWRRTKKPYRETSETRIRGGFLDCRQGRCHYFAAFTMGSINQKFIAEKLGLSRTTVSRCFTNHSKINPQTRALVFQFASTIGFDYSPARNVVTPRPGSMVLVLIGMSSRLVGRDGDTSQDILAGISDKCAGEGLSMRVHYCEPKDFIVHPRSRRILQGLRNEEVKGVILIYPFEEYTVANLMRKFPTISILEDYDNAEVDCVHIDQVRGITRMIQHLYDLGHRRFGFVSWKYSVPTPWVERRFGAFVENLYRLELGFQEEAIINVHRQGQIEPPEVVGRVLDLIHRLQITALVCAADHQAYHLVRSLREAGIAIPGQVSVTGFDGVAPPDGLPQLTSIRMPSRDIGNAAVVSLLRKADHPTAQRTHILVSGKEIIGQTTAACRSLVQVS